MKNYSDSFIQSIGNTPLIKLKAASEITGCNLCLLYTSPSPRDVEESRMPASA